MNFDDLVLECFLENQSQLFPENVAETKEDADDFLCECMAVVVNTVKEVWDYFDASGLDTSGMSEDEILEACEVFKIEDGRFLIVEC